MRLLKSLLIGLASGQSGQASNDGTLYMNFSNGNG